MAYPKRVRQEDTASDTRAFAPTAPSTERVVAPQVTGARGGAPTINKNSLQYRWQGAAARTGSSGRLPVPSTMTLPQAQEQLKDLTGQIKATMDTRFQTMPAQMRERSRFWRMYQQYPEAAATLVARRLWTDQIVGKGNVADWMTFLEGR